MIRRIPAMLADGYFRYISESVVNADFTEAKRNRQDAKKSVALFFQQEYNLCENYKDFWFIPERICRFQSGR